MLHFYEGQVRKFVTQFIRVLSNFSIEMGKGKNGEVNLRQVPVIYGDMTRQVANIIKNNSGANQVRAINITLTLDIQMMTDIG